MSSLRVAVVTESFLPTVNGVTTSVCRVLEHLRLRGHRAMVVAPGPAPAEHAGFPVVAVPSLSFRRFPVGLPGAALSGALDAFAPDVVHAASPFVLAAAGLVAARRRRVATIAVYQTDVAGFARFHGAAGASGAAGRWVARVHARADLTLAPSSAALADLRRLGVPRTALWGRGVDAEQFRPQRRSDPDAVRLRTRALLAPGRGPGEILVGYVGRLAPEKRVERLAALADLPGVRLLVVGDGPAARAVRAALPTATFTGALHGEQLAAAYGALDVFAHTGTQETFGQTVQEALASGLAVVAPAAGGPLDLIRPGSTGLLYPAEDDSGLAAAVAALAADPRLRRELGEAGRRAVEPRSWTALGEELLDHYRHAVMVASGGGQQSAPRALTSNSSHEALSAS